MAQLQLNKHIIETVVIVGNNTEKAVCNLLSEQVTDSTVRTSVRILMLKTGYSLATCHAALHFMTQADLLTKIPKCAHQYQTHYMVDASCNLDSIKNTQNLFKDLHNYITEDVKNRQKKGTSC